MEKKEPIKKNQEIAKKKNSISAEREKIFETRLTRHMDELKWLYMELYDSTEHFESLLNNLEQFYDQRKAELKVLDKKREQDPGWYRKNGMLGMMLYVDQFAGTLNGVREKLDYIKRCNVNYVHLMPLLDTVEGRSDGGYAVADFRKVQEKLGKKLLLPVDTTIAAAFPNPIDGPVEVKVVSSDDIPADMEGLDIGPKTAELYAEAVKSAKTVVWNGPMGVFENPTLAAGTIAVAKALAETEATTIIGGGDSAAAMNQLGFADKVSHISTGGGASLEFLEGKDLPGIAALNDQ